MFAGAVARVHADAAGRYLPLSALVAGTVPPLIGFAGTVAVVVRAIQVMGGSPIEIASAITAMSLAIGVTGGLLSWRWRMPVVLAWSTPGAALLASSAGSIPYPVALGVYVVAAALMMAVAILPWLSRIASNIPPAIASGMLAGILLPFCLKLFGAAPLDPALALAVLGSFLLVRVLAPRHALSVALLVGIATLAIRGVLTNPRHSAAIGAIALHRPEFALATSVGLAIPLFMVTLVSQNLPGLVVMHAAGYHPSARGSFFATGLATVVAAPFGAFGINLAAIVAALCTGPDAHPNHEKRWVVGVLYGATWVTLGLFGGVVVSFLTSLPPTVIAVVTGVALLGPLVGALQAMVSTGDDLDGPVVTFVATASGVTLLGIGSAFWGLVAGFLVFGLRKMREGRRVAAPSVMPPARHFDIKETQQ